jgi:preprotein translocase subunit SecE
MSKIKSFVIGAVDEVRNKVSWPGYSDLQSSSMLVLTASFVFAVVIGLVDLVFKNTISWFYNTF